MSDPAPRRLDHAEVTATWGGFRFQQIFGYRPASETALSMLVDLPGQGPGDPAHFAAYLDATHGTPVLTSEASTALHVLWTASGSTRTINAGIDPVTGYDLLAFDVQPGDALSIPPHVPFSIGPGIVAFVFSARRAIESPDRDGWSRAPMPHPPTHGLQLFDGYNRRTILAANEELLLQRWKITQPLSLHLNPHRWHYFSNLVAPVALSWPHGSMPLGRMKSILLPAGLDRVTLVPEHLGYVLIGSVPELANEVIKPLRAAGYDRAAIASLGVHRELLG